MNLKILKTNRKTIVSKRNRTDGPISFRKDQAIHQFDVQFNTHIKNFIDTERSKLKTLDRKTAKKLIVTAQQNLLKFLKSRSKIYCLRRQQTIHPFHLPSEEKKVLKANIFDENKLKYQILKQQKHRKVETFEPSPLFQRCLKQTADSHQNRMNSSSQTKLKIKREIDYVPLSTHHRKKRLFFEL